jgi:Fe-S oxidoreductase
MGTKNSPEATPIVGEEVSYEANPQAANGDGTAGRPIEIDDGLWNELLALTGGSAAQCFQCGVCTAACPWGLVKEETFSVRKLMRGAQLGLDATDQYLWLCTACGQCEALCPRGVNISDVIRGVRHLAWRERQAPAGLPTVLWSIHGNNNPWDQPPSARSSWAKELQIPYFDAKQHEILLYVGCTAAYDRRIQSVARALVKILQQGGVSFGTLGDDEPCCGEPALSLGHRPFFEELVGVAGSLFAGKGVTRVVTISPHCYHTFLEHMQAADTEIEFLHYSQYLVHLISQDRLVLGEVPVGRVTFHDPCYLARHHSDESSARAVLGELPGIDILEMAHHGSNTICCGGGGGRMWLETAANERFADVRIAEAVEIGANHLITACPFCLACLEDSVKSQNRQDLQVLDLAELVAQAVVSTEQTDNRP